MWPHRLPVSGFEVTVQPPTGMEDLLLQEARVLDTALAFRLFDRLVTISHGAAANWSGLAVTDLEALLLLLRLATLGDVVHAETNCLAARCGARVDVSFRVKDYLASQTPRMPRGVQKIEGTECYRLAAPDVSFRLPNGGDLFAIDHRGILEREMMQRCVQPAEVPARVRRRIDLAMEALAPRLSRTMNAECPECRATMNFYFDVRQFVLNELREHAATIFEDVHLLASYYKWREADILALPRSRRARYAEALRGRWGAA